MCPLRLFNPKGHNIKGVGTPIYGNMIIVPYVDNKAYKAQSLDFEDMLQQMNEIIISSTGDMLQTYCYVTPFIKCKQNINCEINDDIIRNCKQLLIEEFYKYRPVNILLLGSDITKHFLNSLIDINSYYVDVFKRKWFSNYHPGIANHSPDKAEDFRNGLIKWFNSIKNNNYYGYKEIK